MELRPFLLLAVYEAALFTLAWRLVLFAWPSDHPLRPSSLALWVLAAKLYLGGVVAVAILLFVPDRLLGFRAAAGVLGIAAVGAALVGKTRPTSASPPWRLGEWVLVVILATGAGVMMARAPRLLGEIDSLHNFNWMIRWLTDGQSPYAFAYNYVSFWEAGFVPGLLLGESRHLHIWLSAQSLLLYLLALYVLAVRVHLPRAVALSILMAAAFPPWHWGFGSGIPTLKNDIIANAGFLIAVGVLVGQLKAGTTGWRTGVALGLAVTFMTVKFAGPALAVFTLAVAVAIPVLRSRTELRASAVMVIVAVALATVGTGHYYLRLLLLHGNPVYPFAVSLGPIALPGTANVVGTSILNNLGDVRTWMLLSGLDAAGQPNMLLLRAAMVAPAATLFAALAWRRRHDSAIVLVALLAFGGWLAWVASVWSAGIAPGNLTYLEELRSVRYATGAVGASLVVLAALLLRSLSLPVAAVCVLFIADGIVQIIFQLTKYQPIYASPSILMLAAFAATTVVAAACSAAATTRGGRRVAAVAAALAALALLGKIDPVARLRHDFHGASQAFIAGQGPGQIILYQPLAMNQAPHIAGYAYHLLGDDVLARLQRLKVYDEVASRLPDGRDGDLLVMHALTPAAAQIDSHRTQFDRRAAESNWRFAYSDPVAMAYVWKEAPQ